MVTVLWDRELLLSPFYRWGPGTQDKKHAQSPAQSWRSWELNPADLAPRSHAYLLHMIIYRTGFNATSVIGLLCQRDVVGFSCYSVCRELSVTSSIATKPFIEGIQKRKGRTRLPRDFCYCTCLCFTVMCPLVRGTLWTPKHLRASSSSDGSGEGGIQRVSAGVQGDPAAWGSLSGLLEWIIILALPVFTC